MSENGCSWEGAYRLNGVSLKGLCGDEQTLNPDEITGSKNISGDYEERAAITLCIRDFSKYAKKMPEYIMTELLEGRCSFPELARQSLEFRLGNEGLLKTGEHLKNNQEDPEIIFVQKVKEDKRGLDMHLF